MLDYKKVINIVAQAIYDKKGFNILALDVRGFCSMTDYFIIAEGNINRHLQAIAESIDEDMSNEGHEIVRAEGHSACDWIVIDYFDIVIHLFTPSMREKYNFEHLWKDGKLIELDLNLTSCKDQ